MEETILETIKHRKLTPDEIRLIIFICLNKYDCEVKGLLPIGGYEQRIDEVYKAIMKN